MPRALGTHVLTMIHTFRSSSFPLAASLVVATTLAVAGCSVATHSTELAGGPAPVRLTVKPSAVVANGTTAEFRVVDSTADSIVIESLNGVDQYWNDGPTLTARLGSHFGDSVPEPRYATRQGKWLFDVIKKPVKITTCRQRHCREFYHDLTVKLPERNERSIALTGGWATAFTRRAITGGDKSVILREALSNSVWSLQAELAAKSLSARASGYYGRDEYGGALDLSHILKRGDGAGMSYGVAMHLAANHADWLPTGEAGDDGIALTGRTAYQASIGPSIMIKGLTASSQIGVYADGQETLQVLSTFVSFNGSLTEVRNPFSATLEKTFAFGGGPIISRRRDGIERLTFGLQMTQGLALRLGIHSHRSAWPVEGSPNDLRASEVYYSIGFQYGLSW